MYALFLYLEIEAPDRLVLTNSFADENGNIVMEESFDATNHLVNRATWKYDTLNNPIVEKTYDADETETRKSLFKYDNTGKMIEARNIYYGIMLRITYKYDATGNMVEERNYNAEGVQDKRIVYKYDDKGNETEQVFYSTDGKPQKTIAYRNQYDKMGNLLRKIQIDDGREITITRREIAYY